MPNYFWIIMNRPTWRIILKIDCFLRVGFFSKLFSAYSSLSNKRAGWNKVCRLENWTNFESFENLNLCWVDPKHF